MKHKLQVAFNISRHGVAARKFHQHNEVVIDVYLSQKRKGKYHQNLRMTWLKNYGGFGSWLREGKMLAPLTSVVLNGNHLGV
jgi:hypothetical protein